LLLNLEISNPQPSFFLHERRRFNDYQKAKKLFLEPSRVIHKYKSTFFNLKPRHKSKRSEYMEEVIDKKNSQQEEEFLNFRERRINKNTEKVKRLLDRAPEDIRAFKASTIETRRLAPNLAILDIIFSRIRESVGYKVSFEDAKEIFDGFEKIENSINEVIKKAEEKDIYRPREQDRLSDFQKYKDQIIALSCEGKSAEDIAKAIDIDLKRVRKWARSLVSEISQAKAQRSKDELKK